MFIAKTRMRMANHALEGLSTPPDAYCCATMVALKYWVAGCGSDALPLGSVYSFSALANFAMEVPCKTKSTYKERNKGSINEALEECAAGQDCNSFGHARKFWIKLDLQVLLIDFRPALRH